MKRIALAAVLAVFALAPAALAAGTLTGTYKTTIHSTKFGGHLNGTWKVTFKSGHYRVLYKGKLAVKGDNAIHNNVITFTDTGGPDKCPDTGTYKYKQTGNKLKFTKVAEGKACGGRAFVLSHTFTKVS